ncbi:TDT family transporter [Acidithiobacillus sp.]|uniref:TDT family transporter n=1 Tax=Acidithiobacillus sp. TaxID=1872118 RepID=UPI0025835C70|nr:TDT family transporter [Acidithiobacillus sp.]MDD5375033.1 TDT family transporter [Acidithiobacillus sp.]
MNLFSDVPNNDPGEIIRHFTPNWFAATMGTGILALMLEDFPMAHGLLHPVAQALWCVNVFFFVLFSALFLGRALVFPDSFRRLFDHPIQSLFIGCIPMGFATIVNGMILIWPVTANSALWAYGWWWVDAVLAILSVLLVPFFMFTSQVHSLERMTAAWLLPIVPPEVAAASGGLVAQHVAPWLGVSVIYVSYVFWAVSVLLSLGILTILFLRLTLHRLPHRDMAVSSWLPLGPIGTGAMAMITLGDADGHVFTGTSLVPMAQFDHMAGLMVALLLWGFGIWWLCMAAFFTLRYLGEGLPYNMGWWGFTFPLGVYDSSTYLLFKDTHYLPFLVLGAVFTVMLAAFWVVVTQRSLVGMWTGSLFRAPCLSEETGMLEPECSSETDPHSPSGSSKKTLMDRLRS